MKSIRRYVLLSVDTTIDIELKGFIDNIINITKDLDAKSISDIVIKELNNSIYENINKMDQALKWFYTLDTTIENILLFIRSKRFDQDLKYVETNYLKGSKIDFDYIKEYYLDVFDNLGKYLALHFNEEVIKVVKGFKDDISLNQLTDYFTSYFDNDINPYNFSYDTFGPVIDLTMKKRNEIVKLKLFYGIGTMNNEIIALTRNENFIVLSSVGINVRIFNTIELSENIKSSFGNLRLFYMIMKVNLCK